MFEKNYSIGETAKIFGVSVPTIRRWAKSGKLREAFRTCGNHRRFNLTSIEQKLGTRTSNRKVVGYARCSSHDQKQDLDFQAMRLENEGCELVIKDLGSGLNCKKKGLILLMKMIVSSEVETLVLTHKDRLLRFGHELIFKLCDWFGTNIIVINDNDEIPFEQQLATDVITLMTVFFSKIVWQTKLAE